MNFISLITTQIILYDDLINHRIGNIFLTDFHFQVYFNLVTLIFFNWIISYLFYIP